LVVAGGFGLLASGVVVHRRTAGAFAPLMLAAIVAALSVAIGHGLDFPASRPLLAALVTVPLGAAVTITTIELAPIAFVAKAGWSALVAGQLMLYAAGIIVAGELGGLLRRAALPDQHADLLGGGPPWLEMVVFVVASSLYFRPRRTCRVTSRDAASTDDRCGPTSRGCGGAHRRSRAG
jgi:hypothetical protein